MKLRVVGWSSTCAGVEAGEVTWAVRNAIIDEIKEHGYEFSGPTHGDCYGCTPVLNNGKKYLFSTRGWGDIMAEAHGYTGSMDYMIYYMPMEPGTEVLPDTELNEFNYVSVEEMDEILDFDEEDYENGFRYEIVNNEVLKVETDLNERIELNVAKAVVDCAHCDGKIIIPVLPELRYLDNGDTLALVCGKDVAEFTVLEVIRRRALSQKKLKELIDATYDFNDRERAKKAREEIDSATFVLHIKLKKAD